MQQQGLCTSSARVSVWDLELTQPPCQTYKTFLGMEPTDAWHSWHSQVHEATYMRLLRKPSRFSGSQGIMWCILIVNTPVTTGVNTDLLFAPGLLCRHTMWSSASVEHWKSLTFHYPQIWNVKGNRDALCPQQGMDKIFFVYLIIHQAVVYIMWATATHLLQINCANIQTYFIFSFYFN